MGLKVFQIQLTNNLSGVFTAGESITGNVVLELDKPTKCKGVILKFYGGAKVHWTETESSGQTSSTKHYKNKETYFDTSVYLWGNGQGGGIFDSYPQHPSGQIIYPFQFQLPQNIPSSFEGDHGYVRYWLEARVDRPWKFDHKSMLPFSINAVYDLNQYPATSLPRRAQKSKNLCCLCCTSGPITNTLTLERGGYVPGELIVVNGEVDNKTKRKMKSSSLTLEMVTTFVSTSKVRSSTKTLFHLKRGQINRGESEIWSGERIHIPPVPPSDLLFCNIININYYVVLKTEPSGPAFKLEAACEVIIGNVPIQNVQHMYTSSPFVTPIQIRTPIPPGPAYELQPPPSYSTATAPTTARLSLVAPPPSYGQYALGQTYIGDPREDQYTQGNLNFAPQYTYYTWHK